VQLTASSSLPSWISWLLSVYPQEIDLGLDRVKQVAKSMSLLHPSPLVISVAGTNGKGSSVAMIASIYNAAGYKVGCYTSPHILKFNERFTINKLPVNDLEITSAFAEIEQARKKANNIKLTYFEFATLASLVIFARQNLDVIVLEVGLGGRLDAVNIIDADASLITAIDIDHVDWLGSNREKIGIEKAGIMRKNKLSVCSDITPPSSVKSYAQDNQVNYICVGEDFNFQIKKDYWDFVSSNKLFNSISNLVFPNLKGNFQVQNAAGVLSLILSLPLPVSKQNIIKGLQTIEHSGRLQTFTISKNFWIADVAHNPQSISVLATHLQNIKFKGIAIFSVLDDKDYTAMIDDLKPYVSCWYIADLKVERSSSVDNIEKALVKAGVEKKAIKTFSSIEQAVKLAVEKRKSKVLVSGSFFTVAQCYNYLQNQGIYI